MGIKKKFKKGDIYNNVIVAYPEYEFYIHNKKTYINRESEEDGSFSNKVNHTDQGFISLHEINVNRPSDSMVFPFITKDGARTAFRTVTTSEFQDTGQFTFGDQINGTYPLTSSINRVYVYKDEFRNDDDVVVDNKRFLRALYNPIESGGYLSSYFDYETINSDAANIIEVPSIFYGSSIRKKSVQLDYYITGALIAQVKDTKGNGELIETVGPRKGKVAGIVLYEYGICLLTASYALSDDVNTKDFYFESSGDPTFPNWLSFGSGMMESQASDALQTNSGAGGVTDRPSYLIKLEGTNKIPTITMLATANKGEMNYSNNPTFISKNDSSPPTVSSGSYSDGSSKLINITKSKYKGFEEEFENIVYISKIGIYDEDNNLLGIASLSNPIKKSEAQDLLFKLRIDF